MISGARRRPRRWGAPLSASAASGLQNAPQSPPPPHVTRAGWLPPDSADWERRLHQIHPSLEISPRDEGRRWRGGRGRRGRRCSKPSFSRTASWSRGDGALRSRATRGRRFLCDRAHWSCCPLPGRRCTGTLPSLGGVDTVNSLSTPTPPVGRDSPPFARGAPLRGGTPESWPSENAP